MVGEYEEHDHDDDEFASDLTPPSIWSVAEAPIGVRASAIGSFMPEGTYRPIPITWFVAAWVVHSFAMMILVLFLAGRPLVFTLGTTTLASLWIGHKTFAAGMARAATGWKIATVLALLVNWGLAATTAAALGRVLRQPHRSRRL